MSESVVFIGGPNHLGRAELSLTPERVSVNGTLYARLDDPDTGEFLGGYVVEKRETGDVRARERDVPARPRAEARVRGVEVRELPLDALGRVGGGSRDAALGTVRPVRTRAAAPGGAEDGEGDVSEVARDADGNDWRAALEYRDIGWPHWRWSLHSQGSSGAQFGVWRHSLTERGARRGMRRALRRIDRRRERAEVERARSRQWRRV